MTVDAVEAPNLKGLWLNRPMLQAPIWLRNPVLPSERKTIMKT